MFCKIFLLSLPKNIAMIGEIPQKVIVSRELADNETELRRDIRRMQTAYATLRNLPDYSPPREIAELTTDEIDFVTNQRCEKVMADNTLLPTEKDERIRTFKQLHRTVVKNINTICKVISKWPDCIFSYDETAHNIIPVSDLHAIAEAMSVRNVPSKAQEHANLIDSVNTAITQLRAWESKENVTKVRLEILTNWDAETLAAKWANGDILRQTLPDDPTMIGIETRRIIFEKTFL